MTDNTSENVTLDEVKEVLSANFVIRDENDGNAFGNFFDQVAENEVGPRSIDNYRFTRVEYDHPDSDQGDGEKTLIFSVTFYTFDLHNFTRTTRKGTFMITGWYDSWDNGKTDGFWESDIVAVEKREVTLEKWVVENDND